MNDLQKPWWARLGPSGEVIPMADFMAWARWYEENRQGRQIGRDEIQGFLVSTIFLGIDHGFGCGRGLWFETMVFRLREKRGFHGRDEYGQWRYATIEEARAGHIDICEKVRTGEIGE